MSTSIVPSKRKQSNFSREDDRTASQAQALLNENISQNLKATLALGKFMDARTKVMEDIAADELVKELPIDHPERVAHMRQRLEEQRLLREIRIARLKRLKALEEHPMPSSPHRSSSPSDWSHCLFHLLLLLV